jgi:hypothetical protein
MDDQLSVASYQHISDRGRYDKLEELENPASPAPDCKIFQEHIYQLLNHPYELPKRPKTPRISLPNPQSIKIKLKFYMILFILLIYIETNLDGENHLLFSHRDIAPTSLDELVLQH